MQKDSHTKEDSGIDEEDDSGVGDPEKIRRATVLCRMAPVITVTSPILATYPIASDALLDTLENDDNEGVREAAASILYGLFINVNKRFILPNPQPSIARINTIIDKAKDEKMKTKLTEVRDQWANPTPVRKR